MRVLLTLRVGACVANLPRVVAKLVELFELQIRWCC